MRALTPVAIVAILALTFLIAFLVSRRRINTREEIADLRAEVDRRNRLIDRIEDEVVLQLAAGNTSFEFTAGLLRDHRTAALTEEKDTA
jgi:hypothetical protein